jgi:hypothetical protein
MTRAHVPFALSCGLEAAVVLYALMRIGELIVLREPNPALIGPSVHAGYFWRMWIAAYGGGFITLLGALTVSTARLAALATKALPWASAMIVLQALLLP